MKLTLRIVGRHLLLCDEQGDPLPNQTKVEFSDSVDELPRLVVEFIVDGKNISPAESR